MIKFLRNIKSKFSKIIASPVKMSPGRPLGTGYSASANIPSSFNGSKFPGGMSRSLPIVNMDGFALRQQARDAMIDSMEGRALVESMVDTVVDIGLTLKPTPIASMLGLTDEQASDWAEETAKSFHLWAKSKNSHRSRVNNFYQNQRLYELFQQRDNDIFVRFFYGRDWDQLNPLQIEFVDPNQIKGYDYTSTYAQYNDSDDGIVRDDNGRETAYKIWYFKNGKYNSLTVSAIGEKSGRIFMIHGFSPEYAGQGRGYTRMAHLLQELEKLTDFKLSVIQKAIEQASKFMAVENDQQDASNPIESRVAGPPRSYGATETESDSEETGDEYTPVPNYTTIPEATFREPGTGIFNLKSGDHINFLKDTSPSESYESFERAFFSSIAASYGTSEELVRKKFGTSYSANHAVLILCWRIALIWRHEMEGDFLNPTYEMWLSEEIAANRISCPGWSDPRLRAAWLSCEWSGQTMPNIDPVKQATADKANIEIGNQTPDDAARNFNGSSGKANRSKNAKQFKELPEPPWGWGGGKGSAGSEKSQEGNTQGAQEE